MKIAFAFQHHGTTLLTIDASLAFVAVLINAVFAVLVLVRTSRGSIFLIFFLICVATIIWNLGDLMIYFTREKFWFYFSLIGTGMLPALMFHLVSSLVRPEQKDPIWVITLYILSGLIAFSAPLAMYDAGIQRFVDGVAWNICYFGLLIPVFIYTVAVLLSSIRRTNDDEKKRLSYILLAVVIGVLTGITDLVQIMKINVPPLGHLGTVVSSSVLAIGVFKHRTAYDILAQMRMKLEALSEMAAGIAHEIRNPLSSIKGAAKLLSHKLDGEHNQENGEYLDIIREEIDRLDSILVNFQFFTKPIKTESEPISLNDLLRKTVKLAELNTKDMRIILELSEKLEMIQADILSMKQVFLNLVKNAAEACGPGGELIIRTTCDQSYAKIGFLDSGPGIPTNIMNHIFEPFFTTKPAGMGVGLAISKRIVDAHGGRIEVRNVLPRGVEFSILLPVRGKQFYGGNADHR